MAKLRGKAKAAFLAKMAAGRKAAKTKPAKRRRNPRVTKRDVDRAAAEFHSAAMRWGPNNMATQRAEIRYRDAQRAYDEQKAKRRRNPDLLTVSGNPSSKLDQATRRYRQFHGVDPERVTKLSGKGEPLIALGELREIVYQPRRGARKGPAFFHQFKAGNVLATNAAGTKLVIVDRRKRRAVDFDLGIVN